MVTVENPTRSLFWRTSFWSALHEDIDLLIHYTDFQACAYMGDVDPSGPVLPPILLKLQLCASNVMGNTTTCPGVWSTRLQAQPFRQPRRLPILVACVTPSPTLLLIACSNLGLCLWPTVSMDLTCP